jgi:hypothetical protein
MGSLIMGAPFFASFAKSGRPSDARLAEAPALTRVLPSPFDSPLEAWGQDKKTTVIDLDWVARRSARKGRTFRKEHEKWGTRFEIAPSNCLSPPNFSG